MMEEPVVVKSRARHLANRLSALAAAADEAPPKLSKDYLKLAADYRQQEQYRPSSARSRSSCISCKQDLTAAVTKVLYPCSHTVCDNCVLQKRIRVGGQCLCQSDIHVILKNRGGRERHDYDDWLALGCSTVSSSSSFVKHFPLNSQLEIRWATVDRRDTNDKPIRLRSKIRKASQILPVVMEGATTDEEEDETSSSGRTTTATPLPIRREMPNEQERKTGRLCNIL